MSRNIPGPDSDLDETNVSSRARERSSRDFEFTPEYEKEIIALEDETEQKVSQTMSAIESAVESWKAAGKRPPTLRSKIVKLQRFYEELIKWEKQSLEKKTEENINIKIARLKAFVEICSKYSNRNKKRAR